MVSHNRKQFWNYEKHPTLWLCQPSWSILSVCPWDWIFQCRWFSGKKAYMILCAHRMSRSSEQSTNTDHTARTCGRLIYSIVKITRLYDYQTWQTHFWINLRSAQRYVGFFFLIVLSGCCHWLGRNSDQMDVIHHQNRHQSLMKIK